MARPILGGIKALQRFVAEANFPMPVFRTDIYDDATPIPFGEIAGNGRLTSLDKLILERGAGSEIIDCRIESLDRRLAIQFTDFKHLGCFSADQLIEQGFDYSLQALDDPDLDHFMRENARKIDNLAQWGKLEIRFFDYIRRMCGLYTPPNAETVKIGVSTTLVYCATPSRIAGKRDEICSFIVDNGGLPFHPFYAFPFQYYEGHPNVGREKTMAVCLEAVENCDEFWLFGISKGTLEELVHAIKKGKKIKTFMEKFDPDWRTTYQELGDQYGNPLNTLSKRIL